MALHVGFDAFGRDAETQAAGEMRDRIDDRGRLGFDAQPVDEAFVDLDAVDRKVLHAQQVGIAGPKVVERDAEAERLKLG